MAEQTALREDGADPLHKSGERGEQDVVGGVGPGDAGGGATTGSRAARDVETRTTRSTSSRDRPTEAQNSLILRAKARAKLASSKHAAVTTAAGPGAQLELFRMSYKWGYLANQENCVTKNKGEDNETKKCTPKWSCGQTLCGGGTGEDKDKAYSCLYCKQKSLLCPTKESCMKAHVGRVFSCFEHEEQTVI